MDDEPEQDGLGPLSRTPSELARLREQLPWDILLFLMICALFLGAAYYGPSLVDFVFSH